MLCQARWLHAKAEDAARKGRYKEAIQKHHEAAEILQGMLNDVIREKNRQSVELQAEFHAKEEMLAVQHQHRIETIERILGQLRAVQRDLDARSATGSRKSVTLVEGAAAATKSPSGESASAASSSAAEDYGFNQLRSQQKRGAPGGGGSKKKGGILKTDSSSGNRHFTFGSAASRRSSRQHGLEELEVANRHLRNMLDSLFVELDHCQRENSDLRGRIYRLEDEITHSLVWHREHFMRQRQQELEYQRQRGAQMMEMQPILHD